MATATDAEYYVNENPIPFPKTVSELDAVRREAYNAGLALKTEEDVWEKRYRDRDRRILREQMICRLMTQTAAALGAATEETRGVWLAQIEDVVDQTVRYLIATEDKTYV